MGKKLFVTLVARIKEASNQVYHKNMQILKEDSRLQRINSHGIWLIIWFA